MMNITLKGLRMPLTDALTQYSNEKLGSLEKFIHEDAYVHLEIGKPSSHHKGGTDVFHAEINLDSNGHHYFVQVKESDLYVAIDRVVSEMLEMIKQGRGKRHTLLRKGRIAIKDIMRKGMYGKK